LPVVRHCRIIHPWTRRHHTIVETPAYLASAKGLLSDEDRVGIVDMIAANPACGDLIVGCGGVRKVRFAIGNKGKSCGVRVIYLYHGDELPIFLFVVYAKNERTNLTKAQANTIAAVAKRIIETYGA
jgi:hypothetical protein